MANSKIQDFFNRKFFEIPKYLRGFAWDKENIRDLFKVEEFISNYIESLQLFFKSLNSLIKKADKNIKYFKLFSILNLSATLYPLIVKLEMLEKLEDKLPKQEHSKFTFFDLIELIDVRIYKTRGTDPRADISRFTFGLSKKSTNKEIQMNI